MYECTEDLTITRNLPSGYSLTHVGEDTRLGRLRASSGDGFGLAKAHYRLQCESCIVRESVACMRLSSTSRGERVRGRRRLSRRGFVERMVSWEPENESHVGLWIWTGVCITASHVGWI